MEICYGILILVFLILLMYGYDYFKFLKKQKQLKQLEQSIQLELPEFPEAENLNEEEYQHLIGLLYDSKMECYNEMETRRRDMTEYYSMWVHQIKTPIAAMHLLLQSRQQEVSSQDDKMLEEELFHIEQYVEMALQYLRLDAKSTDFLLQKQNLDGIIREAIHKYAKLFIRKKVSLNYEGVEAVVLSDEKWLEFVVEQLLSNAIKYTGKGSISIYLEDADGQRIQKYTEGISEKADGNEGTPERENDEEERQKVYLVVEDTGIGIRPEDLPRVFEKGYTGYNGHSDKSSTGIGLYLCHEVVKKLSHTIEITSEVGKGTKVKIGFFH
ncbi:MAG: sensor histidine kinase [Roseburia sp.]